MKKRVCKECGKEYVPNSNSQKYCEVCSPEVKKENDRNRQRKKRQGKICVDGKWVGTIKKPEHITKLGTTDFGAHANANFELEMRIVRNEKNNTISGKTVGWHNQKRSQGQPLEEKHEEILNATLYSEDEQNIGIYDEDNNLDCTKNELPDEYNFWVSIDEHGEVIGFEALDDESHNVSLDVDISSQNAKKSR